MSAVILPPPGAPPARPSLFLDLDGTLAPIAPTPDAVSADPDRTRLLKRAALTLEGRLAVVSGRPLEDIDRIIEGAAVAAAGMHGLVRRSAAGAVHVNAEPGRLEPVREALDAAAQNCPGLLVEDKGLAIAVHYRAAPSFKPVVLALAAALARSHALKVQRGHMVVELITPGPDKGDAVRAFMAEAPFAGSTPIFVGDDLTDEAAFRAVRDYGGLGVLVGPLRPTAAVARLSDPEAVLCWIADLCGERA